MECPQVSCQPSGHGELSHDAPGDEFLLIVEETVDSVFPLKLHDLTNTLEDEYFVLKNKNILNSLRTNI